MINMLTERFKGIYKLCIALSMFMYIGGVYAQTATNEVSDRNLAVSERPVFSIPRLDGITIDGQATDWGTRGLSVEIAAPRKGELPTRVDADLQLRIGWDENGLLVRADVSDDTVLENHEQEPYLWDSVEMFLANGQTGQHFQVVIAPGVSTGASERQQKIFDFRKDKTRSVAPESQAVKTEDGYCIEARLPWNSLGIKPEFGTQVAFNASLNDRDATDVTSRDELSWYATGWAGNGPSNMQWLKLSKTPSPAVRAASVLHISASLQTASIITYLAEGDTYPKIDFIGEGAPSPGTLARLANERMAFVQTFTLPILKPVAAAVDRPHPGIPGALGEIPVGAPPMGPRARVNRSAATWLVRADGVPVQKIDVPDLSRRRHDAIADAKMKVQTVFAGSDFPGAAFVNPSWISSLAEGYTVKSTYFDAEYKSVTEALHTGRYGMVVEINAPGIAPILKHFTICRVKKISSCRDVTASDMLHKDLLDYGVSRQVINSQAAMIDEYARGCATGRIPVMETRGAFVSALLDLSPAAVSLHHMEWVDMDSKFWDGRSENGKPVNYPYKIEFPKGYNDDKERLWPLLILLHGGGGADKNIKPAKILGDPSVIQENSDRPYFQVRPQCLGLRGGSRGWDPASIVRVIDCICIRYRVDLNRVYLSGMSMGGAGTWNTLTAYPSRFAAAAPICGRTNTDLAWRVCDIPIWVFHGDADSVVPYYHSVNMAKELTRFGAPFKFTTYEGVGHNSWDKAYAEPKLYPWLLDNCRGSNAVLPDEIEFPERAKEIE